jgi:hypothetical protein
MFIVAFEGTPPPDKGEWIEILREVLAGELGSYRVVFRRTPRGFRFEFEWRDDGRIGDSELVANSPDSVGYNIYVNLAGAGKEIDPGWRPDKPRRTLGPRLLRQPDHRAALPRKHERHAVGEAAHVEEAAPAAAVEVLVGAGVGDGGGIEPGPRSRTVITRLSVVRCSPIRVGRRRVVAVAQGVHDRLAQRHADEHGVVGLEAPRAAHADRQLLDVIDRTVADGPGSSTNRADQVPLGWRRKRPRRRASASRSAIWTTPLWTRLAVTGSAKPGPSGEVL